MNFSLEQHLRAELDNAGVERARDRSARQARSRRPNSTSRLGEVGMVESVVQLAAELHLHSLQRRIETLVERQVQRCEDRAATWIARHVAEWAHRYTVDHAGRGRQRDRGKIDVLQRRASRLRLIQ